METAAGLGHVDIELDSDGLVRSIFLEAGFDNRKWRSFASVLLQVHHEDHTLKWQGESRPNTHPSRSNLWWRNQRVLIPFADNSEFQKISYLDVLQEKTTDLSLENKIVLRSFGCRFGHKVSNTFIGSIGTHEWHRASCAST
ncbi:MAG: CHASE2 domain-containing protein [Gammaproteobacteria bacterium]|nr:CHASE2 domain-containing protein [Gammaproteobacteria bacterium]